MPQQLNITGTNTSGTIMQSVNYLYAANGQKLRKQTRIDHQLAATYDYAGRFIYSDLMGDDTQLSYLMANQGRIILHEDGSSGYEYAIKDHLGNTRVTFDENGKILQEDTYYPFGMNISGLSYNQNTIQNKYKYNGKELQDEFGLDWYDYGARFYDAAIGRFHTLDPHLEKYSFQSPFAYAANNPSRYIDANGKNPAILVVGGVVITVDALLISAGLVTSGLILYKAQDGSFALNSNITDYYIKDNDYNSQRETAEIIMNHNKMVNDHVDGSNSDGSPSPKGRKDRNWLRTGVVSVGLFAAVIEDWIRTTNIDDDGENSNEDQSDESIGPSNSSKGIDLTQETLNEIIQKLLKQKYTPPADKTNLVIPVKNVKEEDIDPMADHYRFGAIY